MTTPVLTVGAIPWYKSQQQLALIATAISAIVAIFPKAGAAFGINTTSDVQSTVSTIAGFLTLIIPVISGIARKYSKVQPLTATQAGADVHPATLAANAAGASYASYAPSIPVPPHVSFSPKP